MVKQLVAHSTCHQAREQRASGHVPCARNARPISRTLSHVFVKLAHSGTHVPHIRGCEICFSILSYVCCIPLKVVEQCSDSYGSVAQTVRPFSGCAGLKLFPISL